MLANRIAHVACCHHPQERSQAHKRSLLRHTRTRCLRPLPVTPRSPHEPTAATVLSYAQVSGAGAIPQQVQDPADYDIWGLPRTLSLASGGVRCAMPTPQTGSEDQGIVRRGKPSDGNPDSTAAFDARQPSGHMQRERPAPECSSLDDDAHTVAQATCACPPQGPAP